MTIALLGYILLSLCAARGAEAAASAAVLSSTTTVVDTAVDVGSAEDRAVRVAIKGDETSSKDATNNRRELFYRVDDELLKLWNADDDGTSIRFDRFQFLIACVRRRLEGRRIFLS
jgi:hypothetical protein